MGKILGSIIIQFREFLRGMSPTKRISIISAALIAGVAFVVVMVMVSGKDYVTLLANIPSETLPTVINKLQEKNIPYQMRENGTAIAVPGDLLPSTQMSLMSEIGSNRIGSIGLELFDKQDFGTSSYAQKINYQRAIQGELMRAINTLSAVKQSKVILAMPAKKTFLEEGGQPSASVVIELNPGKILSEDQTRGIQHLVSSAVENLESDRVTVVDERGKVLTRSSDSATAASSEILELKNKVEADYEDRIDSILSKVVGQGKVIAKVDASLNHRQISSVEETVDPDRTAVRSQQSEEESLDGKRTNPAGLPGSRSNLPNAEGTDQVGFNQNVKKEIKTTNWDVPKTTRNVKEATGTLEKLSVAVLVDGTYAQEKKEDGSTETKWVPRTPEEIQKYESLIRNAIGFDAKRGDTVKVENIQFTHEDFTDSDKLLTSLERKRLLNAIFKWALIGFSLALFFFIVVRPFMQWITDSFQDSVEDMLPRTIEELEDLQSVDNSLPGMTAALPVLEESIDPDKAESELMRDRIMNLMTQDEEKAANAFGLWLVRKDP